MSAVVYSLCRAGFEAEAAADLDAIARIARIPIRVDVAPGSATVIAHLERDDTVAWRHAAVSQPPIFIRSLVNGTGPHAIATRGDARSDRITPLLAAYASLAGITGHEAPWHAPWIEYPDTNEGKSLSTLARALDGRLATALHERGFTRANARLQPHVLLVDGTSACVGTSDAKTGSAWPLGIPRVGMPREAPSRSTMKLAEAIAVFLGTREAELMHLGQAAVDLGAAPGGWTWQLVARGLQVTAVDNGALAPALARDPNVEHVRADGLGWRPRRPVDWLVCDIVEKPSRIASLVADWVASGTAASAIFNLKLPMKKRHDEVARCAALIRERLAAAGVEATLVFRQLYHDREEVTGYLATRLPAHSSGRSPRRR